MRSLSSPSLTRISTTSTSYSVIEEALDVKDDGMNPEELDGEVDATSIVCVISH